MPRRIDSRGFTLIETLAAVVIFALAMTFIALAQSDGAAYAGDAVRRTEASLYAEELLVALEQDAATGAPLKPGSRELSEERAGTDYTATIELAPLDPERLGLSLTAKPKARGESAAAAQVEGGLFAKNAAQPGVYQATLHVRWNEGVLEREVTRASFFLNPAALEALAPSDAEQAEPK